MSEPTDPPATAGASAPAFTPEGRAVECQVIYPDDHNFVRAGYEPTCIGQERHAADHPEQYGDPLLSQLRASLNRCLGCKLRLALADQDRLEKELESARGCKPDAWEHVTASERMAHTLKAEAEKERDAPVQPPRATSGTPLNSSAVASGGVAPATGEEF